MKKINLKKFLIFILFNLIIFQTALMYNISDTFSYIDEFVAIIAFIYLIFALKKKFDKFTLLYLTILLLYVMSTIIANYNAGIMKDPFVIFKGIILFLRNFIILIGFYNCSTKTIEQIKEVIPIMIKELKLLLLVALFFWFISLVFNTNMSYDVRFGIKSYSFIFHHPGNFATVLMFILIILTYYKDKSKFIFSNKVYVFFTIFLLITTFRFSYAIALGLHMFYKTIKSKKIKVELKILFSLFLVVATISIVLPQFKLYFIETESPRFIFYKYAFKIFDKYKLGTGFATYGSYMAQVNYSDLYYQYGFNHMYGMTKENPLFLFDNFWPMIITESGIIGLICILLWFCLMLKKAKIMNNTITKIIILYLLAFSIVGQTVIHFSSIILFITMGLTLRPNYAKLTDNKE